MTECAHVRYRLLRSYGGSRSVVNGTYPITEPFVRRRNRHSPLIPLRTWESRTPFGMRLEMRGGEDGI